MTKLSVITTSIRPDQVKRLKGLAAKGKVSKAHVIREALDRYLKQEEGK